MKFTFVFFLEEKKTCYLYHCFVFSLLSDISSLRVLLRFQEQCFLWERGAPLGMDFEITFHMLQTFVSHI